MSRESTGSSVKIGTREVGPGHPCCIVAELSNAHNGDLSRLLKLMTAARDAGADVVKTQAYTVAELVALRGDGPAPEPWGRQGYTMRTLYETAQTPLEWLWLTAQYAADFGIPWFSSVFGAESLAALEAVGCPAYKISHFEVDNEALAALVYDTGKPIVVSTAGGVAPRYYDRGRVLIAACRGGYPAAPSDLHLRDLWEIGALGVSSHCRDPLVGPVAVARGAKYLEYHFHLEAEPSDLEASVSLNEREFTAMVQSVRTAEILLG